MSIEDYVRLGRHIVGGPVPRPLIFYASFALAIGGDSLSARSSAEGSQSEIGGRGD